MPVELRIEVRRFHTLGESAPQGQLDLTALNTNTQQALDWAHKLMHYVCKHGTLPEVPDGPAKA